MCTRPLISVLHFLKASLVKLLYYDWIYEDDSETSACEKIKEIKVIRAARFHPYQYIFWFAQGIECIKQIFASFLVHLCLKLLFNFSVSIQNCDRKLCFPNVHADKVVKHLTPPFDEKTKFSQPILLFDKGFLTQSTYEGSGRQEPNSFEGSLAQAECILPVSSSYPLVYVSFSLSN